MDEEAVRSTIVKQALMAPEVMNRIAVLVADGLIRDLGADECRRLLTC